MVEQDPAIPRGVQLQIGRSTVSLNDPWRPVIDLDQLEISLRVRLAAFRTPTLELLEMTPRLAKRPI